MKCIRCQTPFILPPVLRQIMSKLHIDTPPTLCPNCSHQNRLAFRKDFHYHILPSALSGKSLITVYHPNLPYKVYSPEEWFSDAYNPLDYGRDVDFSKPFFPQFHDLMKAVPHPSMVQLNSINCTYNNFIVDSKNCYLSARIHGEDISYSYLAIKSKDCMDCYNVSSCELCYECIDCTGCYGCRWSNYCKNSSNLTFCYDCIGSSDCFGCVGLRNAKYCWFNEQLTKEEYESKLKQADTSSRSTVETIQQQLASLRSKASERTGCNLNNENATGDYIINSKNIENSFDVEGCEDVADTWGAEYSKDVARCDFIYYGELTYENLANSRSQNVTFSFATFDSHEVSYCMLTYAQTHDCFGSIGLKKNSYVILNKQYSREDYIQLKSKLINHMKSTGEYGQFFSPSFSPFPYNETPGQIYMEETKESATSKGFIWIDDITEPPQVEKIIPAQKLPDTLSNIPDDILNWAISCRACSKPFRIIAKELKFYRDHNLPLPILCPNERYKNRIAKRNKKT